MDPLPGQRKSAKTDLGLNLSLFQGSFKGCKDKGINVKLLVAACKLQGFVASCWFPV